MKSSFKSFKWKTLPLLLGIKNAILCVRKYFRYRFGKCKIVLPEQISNWSTLYRLRRKGTGVFEWCRQTMDDLSVFGTSRTSNELKSGPQLPCQLILMKIWFLGHNISHLWLKMAIIWPIFSHFCRGFALPTTFMRTLGSKWTRNFLIHMARWVEVI